MLVKKNPLTIWYFSRTLPSNWVRIIRQVDSNANESVFRLQSDEIDWIWIVFDWILLKKKIENFSREFSIHRLIYRSGSDGKVEFPWTRDTTELSHGEMRTELLWFLHATARNVFMYLIHRIPPSTHMRHQVLEQWLRSKQKREHMFSD